jgi:hypothetical protein
VTARNLGLFADQVAGEYATDGLIEAPLGYYRDA